MRVQLVFTGELSVLVVNEKHGRTEFRGHPLAGVNAPNGDAVQRVLDGLSGPCVSGLMAGEVIDLPRPGRMANDHAFLMEALKW